MGKCIKYFLTKLSFSILLVTIVYAAPETSESVEQETAPAPEVTPESENEETADSREIKNTDSEIAIENAIESPEPTNNPDTEKILEDAIETKIEAQEEAVKSQNTIDQLTDETRDMVLDYRNAIRKTDSLSAYNQQLAKLVKQQKISLSSIQRQLENAEETQRSIVPFINKMITTLEKFVRLDLPFLLDSTRHQRRR